MAAHPGSSSWWKTAGPARFNPSAREARSCVMAALPGSSTGIRPFAGKHHDARCPPRELVAGAAGGFGTRSGLGAGLGVWSTVPCPVSSIDRSRPPSQMSKALDHSGRKALGWQWFPISLPLGCQTLTASLLCWFRHRFYSADYHLASQEKLRRLWPSMPP